MAIRIVQLGSERAPDEGLRIGTVRRPPRGVPKAEFASRNYYDCWYPELSPEVELMQQALEAIKLRTAGQEAQADKLWKQFEKQFRKQLAEPAADRTLGLLAALSHSCAFSLGCYCDDEAHCHRSILRSLLADKGAILKN
ncbi:DUF488 domain-containing protein [Comamonas thiooxydans]|uniref:DUF488 domain-containing protein n=1 Tax=Comamonas thiooxydans TaxID=363952 RepID=A0A0E3C1V2_9BURK|nr:DUF488 family protein [Comamonas thiooxydans]KGH19372.1 hypothetical protein P608_04010 [Comamonas thiooxydans]KGH27348.1 hypothetical protein P606_03705 [Comamonas thiooxydans]KGH27572.1 hypothetical protein P607_03205 [Comamonas thiooxydans]MCO8248581.1 DUF488 family protein [Comamonas thiooxydans]MDH1253197.1 DUF488 family protein [Comamonas thiooxydans]